METGAAFETVSDCFPSTASSFFKTLKRYSSRDSFPFRLMKIPFFNCYPSILYMRNLPSHPPVQYIPSHSTSSAVTHREPDKDNFLWCRVARAWREGEEGGEGLPGGCVREHLALQVSVQQHETCFHVRCGSALVLMRIRIRIRIQHFCTSIKDVQPSYRRSLHPSKENR